MKRIFKKNQVIITAVAVLIAVSGYINYMDGLNKNASKVSNTKEVTDDSVIEPGDAILTGGNQIVSKVSEIKLHREQTRAKNMESLYAIVNNDKLSEKERSVAIQSVNSIVSNSEKELAIEIMLEGKGFENVIASIDGEKVDILLDASNVDDSKRAQIEDVVVRKTGFELENVVITPIEGTINNEMSEADTAISEKN